MFRKLFGASFAVSFGIVAAGLVGIAFLFAISTGAGLVYFKGLIGIAKSEVADTIKDARRELSEAQIDSLKSSAIHTYGAVKGGRIHESVLYLSRVFQEETYTTILDSLLAEVTHRSKPDATVELDQLLDVLTQRVPDDTAKTGTFLQFVARNEDAFEIARALKPVEVKTNVVSHEGEVEQAYSPPPSFHYSRIDAETGEPVAPDRRSKTPGVHYVGDAGPAPTADLYDRRRER